MEIEEVHLMSDTDLEFGVSSSMSDTKSDLEVGEVSLMSDTDKKDGEGKPTAIE